MKKRTVSKEIRTKAYEKIQQLKNDTVYKSAESIRNKKAGLASAQKRKQLQEENERLRKALLENNINPYLGVDIQ